MKELSLTDIKKIKCTLEGKVVEVEPIELITIKTWEDELWKSIKQNAPREANGFILNAYLNGKPIIVDRKYDERRNKSVFEGYYSILYLKIKEKKKK